MQVHRNRVAARFEVTDDGRGVAARAGLGLVAEVADRIGLTAGLSDATRHTRSWLVHDPGKVLRDVALTLVDGGDALRHMAVLEGQPDLFGTPASPSTACRTVVAVADDADALAAIAAARRAARVVVWAAGGAPPLVGRARARERGETVDDDDRGGVDEPLVVDLDATLSITHSDDKDGAGATYKHTWGFHPPGPWRRAG